MRGRFLSVYLSAGLGMVLGFGLLFFSLSGRAAAQPDVTWPNISLTQVATGLADPIFVTHAGDGSGRLFVVEQAGRIRFIRNKIVSAPFLDIHGRVHSPASGGGTEQGLLSVAFPPQYASKGYFYVYYTNLNGNNQVSRFHLSANPDVADPNSEEPILLLKHPTYSNHNGGELAFGPDGYLYIGTGDGGGGGDPFGNAQNPEALLGKILRIDVEARWTPPPITATQRIYLPILLKDGTPPASLHYAVPPDNPFFGMTGYRNEIWALGLRNPWRYSFDRQTGDLYIGDVGQDRIEEVDFQPAGSPGGENYGWNILEGSLCYKPSSGCIPPANYVPPVAEYDHGANDSNGCSITGGYVYRGSSYPSMAGVYFYADYCLGKIWGLQHDSSGWQSNLLLDTTYSIASFGEDQAGELYLADRNGGIYRIITP